MNSDADNLPDTSGRKRRSVVVYEDGSSSDSSVENTYKKRKPKYYIEESDSESDSVSPIESQKKKRVMQLDSDSSDDSSDNSEIIRKVKKNAKIEYDDDSSEWETCNTQGISEPSSSKAMLNVDETSSDSSDGQSEKCPICLLSFKNQEVGSPEACDHSFCSECIQEWAKSVNTCPVDRRKFNLIIVRSHYNGKYLKSIDVQDPSSNALTDTFEQEIDFTPCEVCGSSLNEDRLLLCDGCDLAYHLDCLEPPLSEVPEGEWFCPTCRNVELGIEIYNLNFFLGDEESDTTVNTTRRYTTPRLIPRTRQVERIRTRIVNQREQNNENTDHEHSSQQPGPSSRSRTTTTTRRKKYKKKRCKKSKKRPKYKIIYEIDEGTGEKVAIKKRVRKYRRKKRKVKRKIKVQRVIVPKSVKNRLARQLGIRPPQNQGQSLPEMKVQKNSGDIGQRRVQAGIPALHLFGQRDELDYFSESDAELETPGINIIVGRRPNRSDASVLRRATRNKAAVLSQPNPVPSVDLLGSILDNQTKLHSRNSIISVKSDGTLKIDIEKKVPSDKPVDIRNQRVTTRQTPMEANTSNEGGTADSSNSNSNQYRGETSYPIYENSLPTSTVGSSDSKDDNHDEKERPEDYSINHLNETCSSDDKKKKKDKNHESGNEEDNVEGTSDSELDIYSDIETVSTSKVEDLNVKYPSPASTQVANIIHNADDDNESDTDLVIDTEKSDPEKYDPEAAFDSDENGKEEAVTSTSESVTTTTKHDYSSTPYNSEIQSETVQSSNQTECASANINSEEQQDQLNDNHDDLDEADELEDDCPNFNIYSSESINLAKTTDVNIIIANSENKSEGDEQNAIDNAEEVLKSPEPSQPPVQEEPKKSKKQKNLGLYSDSEDEAVVKFTPQKPFGIGDISNMTEDISEEERSFTPCLDEKEPVREGLEGLDTEMISDDDKNDFEESQEHELKTVSDGDALEINAKESELDFTRPEECEEGEIIDKLKSKIEEVSNIVEEASSPIDSPKKDNNKENEDQNKEPVFKKLSKSNKDRNYRDKENKERSKSRDRKDKGVRENRKDKRKEKRREIERYDVRSIVEAKPKRDKFGRDPTRRRSYSSSKSNSPPRRFGRDDGPRRSLSRSSHSASPKGVHRHEHHRRSPSYSSRSRSPQRRSLSKGRKSNTPERMRKRRKSLSRSRSRGRKRSRSKQRKRKTVSRERRHSGRKSNDRAKRKNKKRKSRSRTPARKRDWDRRQSRGWTPSLSRSRSPEHRHFTPSWTPPRMMNQVRPQNLTVILPNVTNKKRKEKRKDRTKKSKDVNDKQKKRRRSDRSPPPSKEVFASGNNILVSVSFNKDNEEREERAKRRREVGEELTTKRMRKDKEKQNKKAKRKVKNTSNVKPVAIIDLDRSPFKELTPSPKDVIVLSDSENADSNDVINLQKSHRRESTEQPATTERTTNSNYISSTGPKTPPEPQVKFTFTSKPTQLRAISNPLPQEDEEIDPQEELENRLNEVMHKGPNTPPEPPNSPPSSPDVYDPFDPTKSRTPTPEPVEVNAQSNTTQSIEDTQEDLVDRSSIIDITDKGSPPAVPVSKSHTPPIPVADIQPADSQSSIRAITPDTNIGSSPERPIAVVINQLVQPQPSIFPVTASKSVAPTVYSSGSTSLITSTPVSSNLNLPRINLNSSAITAPTVTSTVSQRIILPTTAKLSPINKVSPTKASAKLTPIKLLPTNKVVAKPAITAKAAWKSKSKSNENNDTNLDFDSPYSPGSSDYEDLFEPPPEVTNVKSVGKQQQNAKNTKSPNKTQTAFDALFGSSPLYANRNKAKANSKPKKHMGRGTKQVGVKLDEDNLKILDELPNSAVEMQVKDKFLKKLNRQERVVEEVKFVLKPYYNKKRVTKEEYKDILRKAVPKICHNKSGEINPKKIQHLVEAYVKRIRHSKKVTSSSSINPQKAEVVSNWLSKIS